jgi:hypothetical protein
VWAKPTASIIGDIRPMLGDEYGVGPSPKTLRIRTRDQTVNTAIRLSSI